MESCWYILKYKKGENSCTEYYPTVLERSRKERELIKADIEYTKETQELSI